MPFFAARRGTPAALQPFIVAWGRKYPGVPLHPEYWEYLHAKEVAEEEAAKEKAPPGAPAAPTFRKEAPPPAAPPTTRIRRPPGEEPTVTVKPEDIDPTIWFDLKDLWDRVKRLRAHEDFPKSKGGVIVPISAAGKDLAAQAEEAAIFFKVPPEQFGKIDPEKRWDFLKIFLVTLEKAIQAKAPKDIPGRFEFSIAPDGTFGLLYTEA